MSALGKIPHENLVMRPMNEEDYPDLPVINIIYENRLLFTVWKQPGFPDREKMNASHLKQYYLKYCPLPAPNAKNVAYNTREKLKKHLKDIHPYEFIGFADIEGDLYNYMEGTLGNRYLHDEFPTEPKRAMSSYSSIELMGLADKKEYIVRKTKNRLLHFEENVKRCEMKINKYRAEITELYTYKQNAEAEPKPVSNSASSAAST
jgi:hypothetical protein